jgi:protein Xni
MPAALRAPLPAYRQAFQELGVATFELPGHEADDVTATLAVKVGATGGNAVILSTDKIFLQLLGDRIAVRDHFRKRDLDGAWVRARFGVGPESLLDLLALTGDGGSSIPGVPGIGPKTAAKLLASWGSLEGALAAAADPAGGGLTPRLAGALRAHAGAARLARSLLAPRTDLELGLNLRDLRVPG